MIENRKVPKLRFPGFEGEWKEVKLGDITSKINSGKTPLGGEKVYTSDGISFIRSQNIFNDRLDLTNQTFISEETNKEMRNSIVQPNDILLNITGASLGRSCVVPNNFTIGNVNQHVCIIRLKEDFCSAFIQPILSSTKGQNLLESLQTGSGREGLNFQSIKGMQIAVPHIKEQNKIVAFLLSVDSKLFQLKKKKSLLEQYKKGIMQKIFTQEIRFKDDDGKDFGEWEEKKLRDLGTIVTGKTPSTKDESLWGGETQFVTPTDISDNKYQISVERYINTTKKVKVLPIGSIMYTCIASIGKISLSVVPCITNQQINTLVPDNLHYNEFLYYSLLHITPFIKSLQANTTLPIINKTDFGKIETPIPELEEQIKIANFLSAIDDKINLVAQQIEKMEVWKKGLLNKMFI